MFIVFEGIDGVGKSTQAARLAERLRADGMDVVEVRHPGQTAAGMDIRSMLENVPAAVMPFLFAADMAITEAEVIAPVLERGAVVVCDRYVASTYAYQGRGYGQSSALSLAKAATNDREPDIMFLMQGEPQLRNDTRFEQESADFYQRVLRGYEDFCSWGMNADRVHAIDGNADDSDRNAEEIYQKVIGMIKPVSSL